MDNKKYFLNTILTLVLGAALLAAVLVRTFAPMIIIPELDVLNMTVVSLIALVLDHYFAKDAKRCYICVAVFSALTFGVLPYMAGFSSAMNAVILGVKGAVVFTVATLLYSSIQDRLSTGPSAKAAPVLSAFGLYLAVQCLAGII